MVAVDRNHCLVLQLYGKDLQFSAAHKTQETFTEANDGNVPKCQWHQTPRKSEFMNTEPCKAPQTPAVKLSYVTVRRHTWRKNWVNCAVLTGNRADLRTVLSSFSLRELCSSSRESHSFLTELTNLMGNLCCASDNPVQFFMQFFYTV
jgi:hypothetical protein